MRGARIRHVSARILIADDDFDLLDAMVAVFEARGFIVEQARDGSELIEAMGDRSFDLVITDISMPWMSGLQVSHSARYTGLATPIVVITALRDPDIPRRVAALGPRARLIRKPFSFAELETAVDELLAAPPRGAFEEGAP
jgi:DNA-binding response OmpR family regulator